MKKLISLFARFKNRKAIKDAENRLKEIRSAQFRCVRYPSEYKKLGIDQRKIEKEINQLKKAI